MPGAVKLVGLDFGTTTSNAVIASAQLLKSATTGRTDVAEIRECYRSDMVWTPLLEDGRLDVRIAETYLDEWLAAGDVRPEDVFGGGAILTGLTAQSENAATLVRLIRGRLRDALIATADDPCFESWLAFMGSCTGLSRAQPTTCFLNLDIGGGTTNLALGRAGNVLRTGCLFVGARHIQVVPGSYQIVKLSSYARALFERLGIDKGPGDCLTEPDVEAVLDFYVELLEAAIGERVECFHDPVAHLHQQVAFQRPPDVTDFVVTFSGGVGELVYGHVKGCPWPPVTHYGDLGIDLARRIVRSQLLGADLQRHQPASAGRATVYGLLRHSTEVSGSSMYLPRPEILPLADLPILGRVMAGTADAEILQMLDLVRRSARGGCVRVELGSHDSTIVRTVGHKIAAGLRTLSFPANHPLVLLVQENVGKVLGSYVTEWGALSVTLTVIDEIAPRDAQFAQVGTLRNQVIPVSFYGLNV